MPRPQQQLGLFAKHWAPGKVKTRLAADFSDRQAAELYLAFLQTTILRFTDLQYHLVLAYSPGEREADFRRLAGRQWQLRPQAAGGLGRRMMSYFEDAFQAGQDHILLIGTDSPSLPVELIHQAFMSLEQAAVVLGPSTDGGYYLVGAARRTPDIFTDIDWSSGRVWEQTVERLKASSTEFVQLREWYDIDDRADLDRLQTELSRSELTDPHLLWLQDRIRDICGE